MTLEPPARSKCCTKGELAITWRKPHSIVGPEAEGWAMILHILVGPPEYASVKVCPFCGKKPVKQKRKKAVK